MKVKGHDGKGNPVEFEPQEKPTVVLKDFIPSQAAQGQSWWYKEHSIDNFDFTPNKTASSKFQNNIYKLVGSVVVSRLRLVDDTYLTDETKKFQCQFVDCTDENGMPDMKVTSFSFIE